MKITKIRLSGFKSFGVETEINLSPRVNCIVGPNGCGKSNIFDAFLWVLGQRTAHSLRGKTMDDCIFFGAKGTPRGSFAEVSLDLDVSDVSDVTATPILDQEKLTITRRHYVQAGSEYFLNNQPIRRTAMIEILRQIGFQESTYSFIGQGKITKFVF